MDGGSHVDSSLAHANDYIQADHCAHLVAFLHAADAIRRLLHALSNYANGFRSGGKENADLLEIRQRHYPRGVKGCDNNSRFCPCDCPLR